MDFMQHSAYLNINLSMVYRYGSLFNWATVEEFFSGGLALILVSVWAHPGQASVLH